MNNITSSWPSATVTYPRLLGPSLEADLQLYPVVAVMGARQVGKSTLCQRIADGRGMKTINLDDRDSLEQAKSDPEGLLADAGESGCFIDEAQRAPQLFLAIKAIVDREKRPGRYLLSGSNQPTVRDGVGESLLGRAAYRTLRPLTLSELRYSDTYDGWSFLFGADESAVLDELHRRAELNGPLAWREIAKSGGFPRVLAARPEQRQRLLNDYVEVFASRDIREVIGVDSSDRFESFLRVVAARTGQELNHSSLSNELGVPVSTVRRWVDALSRSYLIETVPPYSRNASQRVIKAPKLFMIDSALAMAAAREREPTGFHLETLIAQDLCVWKDLSSDRGLHHWRLASQQEVDFVLEEAGQVLPVETKGADQVASRDTRHLQKFREVHANASRGVLLSADPRIIMLQSGILAAPWWAVL
ncbi:MAG: ATP-binding protein [Gemmatimonadaceae bacterium]